MKTGYTKWELRRMALREAWRRCGCVVANPLTAAVALYLIVFAVYKVMGWED